MREVSVIGLGAMGAALARTLLRSGYHVTVWNRTSSKCRPLADAGATVASSVTEAVAASPIVIVCVLDHTTSDALLRTPEVVSKLPGKLLVQLSTGTPQQAREAAVWVKEAGVSFLEGAILAAPEEIGTHEALLVFSGARPLFDEHQEVLQSLGNAVFVGEESSHAAVLDCAVMSVFFGAAMGFLQGALFCDAERLPVQTLAAALEQWFTGTMRVFQRGAERIAAQRVYPSAAHLPLPPALQGLEVIVVDGKAMKRVAKRLKPWQGRKGGVLGGKALVALELRSGLAVAMATPPDGETNDAKLVPAVLPQVREQVAGTRLWVADRQCCDLTQTAAFAAGGEQFLVRYHPQTHFCPEATRPAQPGQDAHGRAWGQDWGWLGCAQAKPRRFVRRLTLSRPGEETIILLTDLLDAAQYPANVLFDLYLARWSMERVFHQITEVFPLQTLIGTTPQGTVFQCAFCLLLDNLVQVVLAYVATAQARPVATISTELLFEDVHRQLVAFTELVPPVQVDPLFPLLPSVEDLRAQLTRLLATVWTSRWLKAPAKKRKVPTPRTPIRGHQTSVYRLVAAYHKQRVIGSLQ